MRSLKQALQIVSILAFAAFLAVAISACDAPTQSTTASTSTLSAVSAAAVATVDTPYRYDQANQICWENQVRTNGASYGATGNTGYFCYGGGASYSDSPHADYPNDITWIGFYTEGTVSLRDQSGNDHVYIPSFPTTSMPCELDLTDSDNNVHAIIGPVNYPGYPSNILDSGDHMQYMEVQTMVNGVLDSGSLWTCEYAGQFGVQ